MSKLQLFSFILLLFSAVIVTVSEAKIVIAIRNSSDAITFEWTKTEKISISIPLNAKQGAVEATDPENSMMTTPTSMHITEPPARTTMVSPHTTKIEQPTTVTEPLVTSEYTTRPTSSSTELHLTTETRVAESVSTTTTPIAVDHPTTSSITQHQSTTTLTAPTSTSETTANDLQHSSTETVSEPPPTATTTVDPEFEPEPEHEEPLEAESASWRKAARDFRNGALAWRNKARILRDKARTDFNEAMRCQNVTSPTLPTNADQNILAPRNLDLFADDLPLWQETVRKWRKDVLSVDNARRNAWRDYAFSCRDDTHAWRDYWDRCRDYARQWEREVRKCRG